MNKDLKAAIGLASLPAVVRALGDNGDIFLLWVLIGS